jgi:hypothetical protein
MDQSEAKEGNSSENASESLHPQPPRKEKKTEVPRPEKAFELSTACSNKDTNDECQRFGNMRVVTTRVDVSFRMGVNSWFYGFYRDTHRQPINPPPARFPSGPSNMYPQSIKPPPHISSTSLHV